MHLKPLQYYIDEYDRQTVKLCRERERDHIRRRDEALKSGADPALTELMHKLVMFYDVELLAGTHWENKQQTVKQWMQRDQTRDELLTTTKPPDHVFCLTCRAKMTVVGTDIDEMAADGHDRLRFIYECPTGCMPRRVFFDGGEEFRPVPATCPVCKSAVAKNVVRNEGTITLTETCIHCNHVETTVYDPPVRATEIDHNFARDYQRFCLTGEQGKEYLSTRAHLDWIKGKNQEDIMEQEIAFMTEQIAKIQKLDIASVERLLSTEMEKNHFGCLHFGMPEIKKVFSVSFTAQNRQDSRSEHQAVTELQSLIRTILAPTNWRLMREGIKIQLGVLTGRLRGYDKEYELAELIRQNKPGI